MPTTEEAEQLAQSLKNRLDAINGIYQDALLDIREYLKKKAAESQMTPPAQVVEMLEKSAEAPAPTKRVRA